MKNIEHIDGFTLIELIVTLSILTILVAFAVPSLRMMIHKNQLIQDTHQFIETVQKARSTAILKKTETTSTGWVFSHSEWDGSPPTTAVTFNFMGYLSPLTDLCFVLKSTEDASLKQVVIVSRDGFVLYDKKANSCNG